MVALSPLPLAGVLATTNDCMNSTTFTTPLMCSPLKNHHHHLCNDSSNRKSQLVGQRSGVESVDLSLIDDQVILSPHDPLADYTTISVSHFLATNRRRLPEKIQNVQRKTFRRCIYGAQQSLKGWTENARKIIKGRFSIFLQALLPFLWAVSLMTAPSLSTIHALAGFAASITPLTKTVMAHGHDIKIACHHFIRDSGLFRTLMDTLVIIGLPSVAIQYPTAVSDFIQLGKQRTRVPYGKDAPKSQILDLYMPQSSNGKCATATARGLVFFVHGGAWGSGSAWMYRLVAKPFLEKGMAVAIVGYRKYPEGDMLAQVEDLNLAAAELSRRYPELCFGSTELGNILVGHSSGAHISAMFLVEQLRRRIESNRAGTGHAADKGLMRIDFFVGISGPYDIARHFQFEASRGLEELSPMKPACRGQLLFERLSPTIQLSKLLIESSADDIRRLDIPFPSVAFVHGLEDDTVPPESSQRAANLIRASLVAKCEALYLANIGHCETILELMFGGRTQDAVVGWIEERSEITSPSLSCFA